MKTTFAHRVGRKIAIKSFNVPDEKRVFPKGKLDLVIVNGVTVGRAVLEPGWRGSDSVKPIAKTMACQAPHFQYQLSGTLCIEMADGTQRECKAGDVCAVGSGHDAWVVGGEPVILVDFQGMARYAKPHRARKH